MNKLIEFLYFLIMFSFSVEVFFFLRTSEAELLWFLFYLKFFIFVSSWWFGNQKLHRMDLKFLCFILFRDKFALLTDFRELLQQKKKRETDSKLPYDTHIINEIFRRFSSDILSYLWLEKESWNIRVSFSGTLSFNYKKPTEKP